MDTTDEKILPFPKTHRMGYGHFLVVCYLMLSAAYREQKKKSPVFKNIIDGVRPHDENMANALENIRHCIQDETENGVLVDTKLLIKIGRQAGFHIPKDKEKTLFEDLNKCAEELSMSIEEYHKNMRENNK